MLNWVSCGRSCKIYLNNKISGPTLVCPLELGGGEGCLLLADTRRQLITEMETRKRPPRHEDITVTSTQSGPAAVPTPTTCTRRKVSKYFFSIEVKYFF